MLTKRGALVFGVAALFGAMFVMAPAAGAAITSGGSGGAAGVRVYTDAAGDAKGGPDIRRVTISDSKGVVTFKINVLGLKKRLGSAYAAVVTWLDTNGDGNDEYALQIGEDARGTSWGVFRWNPGSKKPVQLPEKASGQFWVSGNAYIWKITSWGLGGATGFDFSSASATWDEGGKRTDADTAPKTGTWSYDMRSVKLLLGTATVSPVTPVAGRVFKLTVPVTRSDGGPLGETLLSMSLPSVGGKTIIPPDMQTQLRNGKVSISFTVPATATGKLLKLSVTVMSGRRGVRDVPGISTWNLETTRSFSFLVRGEGAAAQALYGPSAKVLLWAASIEP
jgi:hypothetical protein